MAIPNTTPTPNELYNGEMKKMTDTELRVVLIVTRATLGWEVDKETGMRKKEDWISYYQLKQKSGRGYTALSQAIDNCVKKGWIEARDKEGNILDKKEKRHGKKIFYRLGRVFLDKIKEEPTFSEQIYFDEEFIENRARYKLDVNISSAIRKCLKGQKGGREWEKLVGYTLEDLKKHLENQFDEKMNWENYGTYWHLDHKIPKSWFNYEKPEDEEFKECCALENLQPLEAKKNLIKNNKYSDLSTFSESESAESESAESEAYKRNTITKEKTITKDIVGQADNEEKEFNFDDYLKKIKNNKQRHIQIIALYWQYKGFRFQNKQQVEAALKRELRPAKMLVGYSDEEIIKTMDWLCENVNFKWALETVHKFIDENLNELEPIKPKKYDRGY